MTKIAVRSFILTGPLLASTVFGNEASARRPRAARKMLELLRKY